MMGWQRRGDEKGGGVRSLQRSFLKDPQSLRNTSMNMILSPETANTGEKTN